MTKSNAEKRCMQPRWNENKQIQIEESGIESDDMHDTDEGGHVFKNDNLIKDSTSNLQNTNSKDTIPNYH